MGGASTGGPRPVAPLAADGGAAGPLPLSQAATFVQDVEKRGTGMSLFGGADPFANDPFFASMGGGMSMGGGGGSFSSSTSSFSVGANGVRTGKTVRTSATIDSQGRRVTRTETTTHHPDGTSTSTVDERVDGAGAGPRIEDQRHGSGKREAAVQLAPQPTSRNSFTSPFSSWGSKF